MGKRHVVEGVQVQGVDEEIYYTLTTTPWGSSPASVDVVVKDITNADRTTTVTSTTTTGSPSVVGDVITLPKLHSLRAKHKYQVEVAFTDSGNNRFEALIEVWAEE